MWPYSVAQYDGLCPELSRIEGSDPCNQEKKIPHDLNKKMEGKRNKERRKRIYLYKLC